ncbi:MAG: hypothetical protein ACI9QC_000270 [Oceanicoccus sp.]|jgi:hypothetical protein
MTYTSNFDGLVQFQSDIIEPLTRGASLDSVTFPPGYREIYEQWTEVVGEALIKMNPDDRLTSFSDYLREDNKRFADKAIKRMLVTPGQKKQWRQAATRGQVLRVSTDGKKFNKLIRTDQLSKNSGDTMFIVSDTCRSTTNDFSEVANEQSALLITGKLRSQHFLVQNVEPGKVFKAEVVHPKTGVYTVTVDLAKPFTELLSFEFKNGQGESKKVAMNEVGEAYGILENSMTTKSDVLELATEGMAGAGMKGHAKQQANNRINKAAAAAAVAAAAMKKKKGLQAGEMPYREMPGGFQVPTNVMAGKDNVEARMQNAEVEVEQSKEQSKETYEKRKASMHEAADYRSERKEKRSVMLKKQEKNQSAMLKTAGFAGAASGLASAALTWIAM